MENDINKLILDELTCARIKFADFHSSHEGFAVITEEIEEMNDEHKKFITNFKELWQNIKSNDLYTQKRTIIRIKTNIKDLIKEAIQVGAMIEKLDQDVK